MLLSWREFPASAFVLKFDLILAVCDTATPLLMLSFIPRQNLAFMYLVAFSHGYPGVYLKFYHQIRYTAVDMPTFSVWDHEDRQGKLK